MNNIRTSLVLLVVSLLVTPALYAASFYVGPGGNDSNTGQSVTQAWATVAKAVQAAAPGDTVYLRGGTYRQQVDVTTGGGNAGNNVTVCAYRSEKPILKGSNGVTGWTKYSGTVWRKTNWNINSQQVFVDGTPLQQIGMPSTYYDSYKYDHPVGSGLGDMAPGRFFYDPSDGTLYVQLADNSSPNNHTMEASVRLRIFFSSRPFLTVKGLTFRHSNAGAFTDSAAAVELGSGSILQNCDVQWCDFAGVSLGYQQSGVTLDACTISHNGDVGVNGPLSTNYEVRNCRIQNNNYRHFNTSWHAGGLKMIPDSWGVIEGCEVSGNYGQGIWIDTCNTIYNTIIRNNYIHDNTSGQGGVMFEISRNGQIYNNIITQNDTRGVYLSACSQVQFFNNTLAYNSGFMALEMGGMPRQGYTLNNNRLFNNIFYNDANTNDLGAYLNGFTPDIHDNSVDNNLYFKSGGMNNIGRTYTIDASGNQQWQGHASTSLSDWQSVTNWDAHAKVAMPAFNVGIANDFSIPKSSPAYNSGQATPSAMFDYTWKPRPVDGVVDIGAYEAR